MLLWMPPFKVPVCCQNRLHHAFRGVASHGPPLAEPVPQDLDLARADPVSGGLFFVTVTVDVTVKCGFVVVK
jgi:hypothetical protein